ncbi:phage baseplate assembly protein V [Erythrobacter ani]|uniref:Phage baseplate assembly protein V n=1 Tax=Erythrobacter ani TaxID=2827235 RepID=A0ABS6SP96_9SPHN|nr:phage baseplate assembly protein V [Erythrobacter ani]MBV7266243.1 phage baseplate assembly protein V [Erythrobacter ani]
MMGGAMPGLVIGSVIENEDPDNQGRIRVSYSGIDQSLESDWIPYSAPFAGPDRGLFFIPELDDEVIIGFLHGDFNHPIVLGSMWNGQAEAPATDPRVRMLRSKNGHSLRFIDSTPDNGDNGAIWLDDPHENALMMCNTHVVLRASGTLRLEGANIMINGRTIEPNNNKI